MALTNFFSQDWIDIIGEAKLSSMLSTISEELLEQRKLYNIYPEAGSPLLFKAFRETPYLKTKVIIIGQD